MTTATTTYLTTYLTTTDHAAEIRAGLKAAGIKASVRCSRGSIDIRVNTGSVAAARALAQGHEQVSRCERTGEILCGGNRFVSVCASDTLVAALAAPIADAVAAAFALVAKGAAGSTIEPVAGTAYGLAWNPNYSSVMVWRLGHGAAIHGCIVRDAACAAQCIATCLADG